MTALKEKSIKKVGIFVLRRMEPQMVWGTSSPALEKHQRTLGERRKDISVFVIKTELKTKHRVIPCGKCIVD